MQLFLHLQGVPRQRVRVAVLTEDGDEIDGTRPSTKQDPMFEDHVELFGEASGKNASLPLVFTVQAVGTSDRWREALLVPIATARITSDALRRAGMYNPHEGAAIALSLRWADEASSLPAALLHCYVHAGYYGHHNLSRRHSCGTGSASRARRGGREAAELVAARANSTRSPSASCRSCSSTEHAARLSMRLD